MLRRGRPPGIVGKKPKNRPQRTREHVIAYLSLIHVQWIVANSGYVAEEVGNDYGYDLVLWTYSDAGELENGAIYLQIKATDDLDQYIVDAGRAISIPVETRHVQLWRGEPMPVILVIYDAQRQRAYWLYAQRYFQDGRFRMNADQSRVSVHVSTANVVDQAAVQLFRAYKEEVLTLLRGASLHGE